MPTNPVVDAIGGLSRGNDCRHEAPPLQSARPPARQAGDRLTPELNCRSEDAKSGHHGKCDGGKGQPHLLHPLRVDHLTHRHKSRSRHSSGSGHWRNENPARRSTWRGLGNPLAKERNSQRAPLGQLVGAVDVSWGVWQGTSRCSRPAGSTNSGTATPGRLTSACGDRHIQQELTETAHA
jgi:hypothetical protein